MCKYVVDKEHIFIFYLWQDSDYYLWKNENEKLTKILDTTFNVWNYDNKQTVIIKDVYIELYDLFENKINHKEIIWEYLTKSHGRQEKYLENIDDIINNQNEVIEEQFIRFRFNVADVPNKAKLYYRIKFVHNGEEHIKENTVYLTKLIITEPQPYMVFHNFQHKVVNESYITALLKY